MLKSSRFNTILGEMLAIGDEHNLYLLEFTDYRPLDRAIRQLERHTKSMIAEGDSAPLSSIRSEMELYLNSDLRDFNTPIMLIGTEFQKLTWSALQKIPYGATISYAELASTIGRPKAFRAAANSNGANKLVIITPCHRVIGSGGSLGGYSSGLDRKRWLLELERG